MYSDNLVIKLNTIAHQYGGMIDRAIHEVLSKYNRTGALLASVHTEVIDGDQNKAPQIKVTFDDALNIIDKRKLQWTKQPPVDDLEAWGEAITFKGPVPGYKNGAPNLPPWKQKQRIEWAIAINKRKFDTWKAKPWRKKSLSNVLKEMNKLVLLAFDKAIEEDLQLAVNKGLANGGISN